MGYLYFFLKAVSHPPCSGSPNSSHFPVVLGGEWLQSHSLEQEVRLPRELLSHSLCTVCSPVKISLENPHTKDQPGQLSNTWKRSKSGVSQPQEHCAWQGAFYSLASQNHRKGEQSAGSNPPVGVAHASQVELDGSGIPGSYQFREQICFPFG